MTAFVVVTEQAQLRCDRLPDFSGGLRDRPGRAPRTETSLSQADIARMAAATGAKYQGRVRKKL